MASGWRYYDFDANWDRFYEAWSNVIVQQTLLQSMEDWNETWKKGDSLWDLTNTNYWTHKVFDRVD
jgi:hypothetical protein